MEIALAHLVVVRELFTLPGPTLVGATFLWSGAIKALAPHGFRNHLAQLKWFPPRLIRSTVTVAAALESAWGVALIAGVAPRLVLPATAVLLAALTVVTVWTVRSGQVADCGCYGGYIVPSLAQSIALNSLFAALVLVPFALGPISPGNQWLRVTIAAVVGVLAGGVAALSQWMLIYKGRLLFAMSPLKVGGRFKSRWASGATTDLDGEILVSYLGVDCPHCKVWVRVLNAVSASQTLPHAVGLVAGAKDAVGTFAETAGIRFPVEAISPALLSRLVYGVPTTVLVESGVIREMWSGPMPPEFFERFKEAFFPGALDGDGPAATVLPAVGIGTRHDQ
jgi:hypothetical protein